MSYTAHTDTFARDRLPPGDQQPEFLLERPELQFPPVLNCAEALLDRWIEAGEGGRACLHSPSEASWTYRDLHEQANRIAQEEIFGPVLSVLTFRTPSEAVEKANNTAYGLSAGVWTEKGSRILSMANKLRAGVVWANTFNRFDPTSPFGGYKESGFGREGGRHGLEAYLDV